MLRNGLAAAPIGVLMLGVWCVPAGAQSPAAGGGGDRNPKAGGAVRRLEQAYLRRRFEEAKRWYERDRFHEVIDRCTAILNLEPGLPWRGDVRALRLKAKERAQYADVLQAELLPERDHLPIGGVIRVQVKLTARAKDPVEWRLSEGAAGAHAVCDVHVREHGLGRTEAYESFRVPIRGLPMEAVLKQGDAIAGTIAIPTHNYAPLRPTPRTYRLVASIRPLHMRAGPRSAHRQVLVPAATVEVWPRGAERLAGDPVAAMTVAIREEWPFRTTAIAFCTPEAQRAQVAERLLNAIGGGFERGAMWPAAYGALRRLTGEDLPDTRSAWLGYWSRVQAAAAKDR